MWAILWESTPVRWAQAPRLGSRNRAVALYFCRFF